MQNINTWLRESAQGSARELVHINEKELFHRNIAGFGMREKVIDVLGELRAALFPSLYESSETKKEYIEVHVTEHLNRAAIGLGGNHPADTGKQMRKSRPCKLRSLQRCS